jgi:hypothetical protein
VTDQAPPSWPPDYIPPPPPPPASTHRGLIIGLGAAGVAVIVALVLLLVGRSSTPAGSNGESQKTASQILNDSASAFDNVRSVHLTGKGSSGTETDVYDLRVSGGGTEGTITADGAVANFVNLGNDVYMRGRAFFTKFGGAQAGAVIGDRWVHLKADDPQFGKYVQFLTLPGLRQVISGIAAKSTVGKGAATHVGGALVMPLRAVDGEVDVALDGKPYPARLQFKDTDRSADLRFTEYDATTTPPARPTDVLELPGSPSA